MRVFYDENVYDAAKKRIAYIMDRFNVAVTFSGGKDSTVLLYLTLEVAREQGKLPLTVIFLDQEAEWQNAIDYMRVVAAMPDVDMRWYQIPFKITHSHSKDTLFMECWDEKLTEDQWMRHKEPGAITENDLFKGTGKRRKPVDKLFKSVLDAIQRNHFPDNTCFLGGVRAEESPGRMMSLTNSAVFDGLTYGKQMKKSGGKCVMYPIYDWSYKDVWKAIHDNNWPYAKLYDLMYAYGVPVLRMRLSSLCHENAVRSLSQLQDFERETWEKLSTRLDGIATGKNKWAVNCPSKLPFMFKDWREYRDYLAENLLSDEDRPKLLARFASGDAKYVDSGLLTDDLIVTYMTYGVQSILRNDYYFVALDDFAAQLNYGHDVDYNHDRKVAAKKRRDAAEARA